MFVEAVPARGWLSKEGSQSLKRFDQLPISKYSLDGLKRGGFEFLTRIQKSAIMHALAGRDVLAAAKTGSGKTLAFLIPLFEKLYLSNWTPDLGVGAVIITPTRELALQIYEVIRVVGCKHRITVGLFIGSGGSKAKANSFEREQENAVLVNIVVCTPGRFLQHLEQTPYLNTNDTSLLVLDEADRLLDLGFKPQLLKILEYLPKPEKFKDQKTKCEPLRRQTLLFSATQTTSVKDLARLSLMDPEYIAVHEKSSSATPKQLVQIYSVVDLPNKLAVLYAFLRNHLKSKIIVFFSSCKQVQFVDAAFRKLQPGLRLMALHGKMKQVKRMAVYTDFIQHNQNEPTQQEQKQGFRKGKKQVNKPARKVKSGPGICLFATDIVARGLDFPNVDWVIQVDCPEDIETYIHRVGRTARYRFTGKALLMLTPLEAEGFVPLLSKSKIPCAEKQINPSRLSTAQPGSNKSAGVGFDLNRKLASEIAKDAALKVLAQKAFKSYIRSVHLQPNKAVFNAKKLTIAAFAKSLGLPSTPRIKISGIGGERERAELRKVKNTRQSHHLLSGSEEEETPKVEPKTKWERLMSRKRRETGMLESETVFTIQQEGDDAATQPRKNKAKLQVTEEDEEEEEDILVFKRKLAPLETSEEVDPHFYQSRNARKKLKISKDGIKKGKVRGTRTVFDDETGEARSEFELLVKKINNERAVDETNRAEYVSDVTGRLKASEAIDKQEERKRIKEKHRKQRVKTRRQNLAEDEEDASSGSYSDASSQEDEASSYDEPPDLEAAALGLINS